MSRTPDLTAKISLLRASEAVFAEKGLQLAKVEDITRRAGLSKGAFYLHFESKEEAFEQVVESFLARCIDHLPPPTAADAPPGADGMLAHWLDVDTQVHEFLWQNRATVAILQGCQDHHVHLLEAFTENIQRRSQEWIEFWKRRGFFRADVDTALVAIILCGAHNELSRKMLAAPKRPPIREWIRQTQSVFARGLGTQALIDALEDNPPVSQDGTPASETPPAPAKRRTRAM